MNNRPVFHKPAKLTPAERAAGKRHVRRVKLLCCVICQRPGPSDVHHCICDRYGTRRATDFDVIPLCELCHRYPHPLAIHSGKESWVARNGADHEYIATVADMLAGELTGDSHD